ncbi:lysophospholipase [Propionibacterium sp.]|uniref:alpha/beta hydrolase n=1 Tax=Propionibacterium sp. TaxID=1977903 RepID=UPI0039EB44EF
MTTARVGHLVTPDGERLLVRTWLSQGTPRAVLQICHGMAEHSRRYGELATTLADDGWVVVAHDHRGHGGTARTPQRAGWFAREDGWNVVVDDVHRVRARIAQDHPGLPVFLLGHSMGSQIARDAAIRWSDEFDGLALSGPNAAMGWRVRPSAWVASLVGKARNPRRPSVLLDKLGTGGFNKAIKERRTDFDWLSTDEAEVDAYLADPWCGFTCTPSFFQDMITGSVRVNDQGLVGLVRPDLPVLVMAGTEDPVGKGAATARSVVKQYRKAGLDDVTLELCEGDRHEVFHEIDRAENIAVLRAWLDEKLTS